MLNQDLRQQLSQEMALILLQPKGEPEYDMKELQSTRNTIMASAPQPSQAATADDLHQTQRISRRGSNALIQNPLPVGEGFVFTVALPHAE